MMVILVNGDGVISILVNGDGNIHLVVGDGKR